MYSRVQNFPDLSLGAGIASSVVVLQCQKPSITRKEHDFTGHLSVGVDIFSFPVKIGVMQGPKKNAFESSDLIIQVLH
jgi:hypothetical protein